MPEPKDPYDALVKAAKQIRDTPALAGFVVGPETFAVMEGQLRAGCDSITGDPTAERHRWRGTPVRVFAGVPRGCLVAFRDADALAKYVRLRGEGVGHTEALVRVAAGIDSDPFPMIDDSFDAPTLTDDDLKWQPKCNTRP